MQRLRNSNVFHSVNRNRRTHGRSQKSCSGVNKIGQHRTSQKGHRQSVQCQKIVTKLFDILCQSSLFSYV